MTLPTISPKRLALMKSGKIKTRGTFTIDVEAIRARQSDNAKKVAEALFGVSKSQQGVSRGPKTDKQKWKAKAIKYFSEFIRLRDSGADGYGTCVTCPRTAHWKTFDAGHFVSCAREATRFDENNVHMQCKGCNRFQGGKFLQHEASVDRIHGEGTAKRIKDKAFLECRRDAEDYKSIAETYKFHVDRIKSMEPLKYKSPNQQ